MNNDHQKKKKYIIKEDIHKCWENHFEELFSKNNPENDALMTPAIDTLDINTDPPSVKKIKYRQVISQLKGGKSAGIDQINTELLKSKI